MKTSRTDLAATTGRSQIRKTSAFVAGLVLLLASCGLGGQEGEEHELSDSGRTIGPIIGEPAERIKLTELRPDSCFTQDWLPDSEGMIQLVHCIGPHKYRTYAVSQLPNELQTDSFPDADKVERSAMTFCDAEYENLFHGRPGKEGRPVQYVSYPVDETQWRLGGKMIVCATAKFLS